MPKLIIYNPTSPAVANRVVSYFPSKPDSECIGVPNSLVFTQSPEIDALVAAGVPITQWKVSGGIVVQLSGADLTALANQAATDQAAKVAAKLAASKTEAINHLSAQFDLRDALLALVETIVPEINALRGVIIGVATLVWDAPSLTNATGATSNNLTVTGAAFGDFVDVACSGSLAGLTATAYVSAADTVVIRLHNGTGATVNLASLTYNVCVRRQVAMPARTANQVQTALTNAYQTRINAWT